MEKLVILLFLASLMVNKAVSIKYGLWTTDCGLGIKYGLRTEYKTLTR